jgi:hypothetical protein
MKCAAEMGFGAMIYIPSVISSGIPKLIGDKETHIQHGNLISLLCMIKIRKGGL